MEADKICSVRTIRTVEEIESIREAWERMQWHPNSDIDYYLMLNDSRPEIVRPHIIALDVDGEPKTLLIGRIETTRLDLKMGYLSILRPMVQCLSIVYGGWLGDTTIPSCRLLIAALLDVLRQGDADVVFINHLPTDSNMYNVAVTALGWWRRDHFLSNGVHWKAIIQNSYDEYCLHRSVNTRHNLRKWPKKLSRDYGERLKVRRFDSLDDFELAMQDMNTIATKTYQRGMGLGFRDDIQTRKRFEFHFERKRFCAYILYIDDKPIAFWNGLRYGATFFGDTNGYDPDYSRYRPGHFILLRLIEDLCADKTIEALDFGFGDAEYKRELCDRYWTEASVYLFSSSLKGTAIYVIRTMLAGVSRCLENLVRRVNRLEYAKKLWRGRLSRKATRDVKGSD